MRKNDELALYMELADKVSNNVFVKNMKREEWKELRRSSIGGSDAGAIIGMNKWASPLTVYLDKKGINAFEGNVATKRGAWLETPIRERCKEELGVIVEEVPFMFYSNDYPFMSANIDGLVYTDNKKKITGVEIVGLGGLEIKTSECGDGFKDNEVPDSYYAQVQHYMAVLQLPYFILSAYIINKDELKHYVIKRDDAFIEKLVEAEKVFWKKYVEKDVMPSPSGCSAENDVIEMMFEGSQQTIELSEEYEGLCAEYLLLNEQIKEKEAKKAKVANKIKLKIIEEQTGKETGKVQAQAGSYKISFSKFLRKSVDTDALKKAGLYDEYAKISESSLFRITESKTR